MAENKLYFTYGWNDEKKTYIGVISLGQVQVGDENVVVLSIGTSKSVKGIKKWGKQEMKEKPWETRH